MHFMLFTMSRIWLFLLQMREGEMWQGCVKRDKCRHNILCNVESAVVAALTSPRALFAQCGSKGRIRWQQKNIEDRQTERKGKLSECSVWQG